MAEKIYNYVEVYAAMCLWEEIVSSSSNMAGEPWLGVREAVGTTELRGMVIGMASACNAAWERAHAAYEAADASWRHRRSVRGAQGTPFLDPRPQNLGSFAWGFVPTWLRMAVDWSDHTNGPRVLGTPRGGDHG